MFYMDFDNHERSRIILRRIHEDMFWVRDIPVMIDNKLIHKFSSLSNEGCNIVNEKNVKKLVETNQKTKFDGRNMKLDLITKIDVRLISKNIGYKMNYNSRVNSIPTGFIHLIYLIVQILTLGQQVCTMHTCRLSLKT